MIAVELTFEIKKRGSADNQESALSWWIGSLTRNGSLFGVPIMAKTRNGWIVLGVAPDSYAFRQKNLGKWASKRLSEVRQAGVVGPRVRILGPVPETRGTCKCLKPSGYILFTTYLAMEPPVRCLRCYDAVPIYRLPRDEHGEYSDLNSWESNYQACDTLQMGCEVGERFGMREMADIKSSLSRAGIAVCGRLEEQTGLPVYYYLHRAKARSHEAELERRCPRCSGIWRRKRPLHRLFDFKCDKCRLLSNISFDFR